MYLPVLKNNKGFTLVELIIVIAVIGVLAGALFFLLDPIAQLKKGRDATHQSDVRQLQGALELYRSQYGHYPTSLPTCGAAWCTDATGTTVACTNPGVTTLLQNVPCDSTQAPAATYKYTSCATDSGGKTIQYVINGCMEYSGSNPQGAFSAGSPPACSNPLPSCSAVTTTFYFTNP